MQNTDSKWNLLIICQHKCPCKMFHNHCRAGILQFVGCRIIFIQNRSSHPEVFLGGVLKKCSKFTGEHLCWSKISIKLQSNFIEVTLRHGRSRVNLLAYFQNTFSQEHLWTAASVMHKDISTPYFVTSFLYICQ